MSLKSLLRKKRDKLLFTTPSHSGRLFVFRKLRNLYRFDISETDCYSPQDVLAESQKWAAKIYGTKQTIYLTNGSTSGIITAVLSCTQKDEKVLIWKYSHICHKNAVKLAGGVAVYYDVEIDLEWGIPKSVNPELIENYLSKGSFAAVIVTSPTYEGVTSDIQKISEICHRYGAKLIVDEAHGALYPFFDELPESAVNIADFTVQSLHKTAGGLNPTALLHNNTELDVTHAFKLINTTSPSYPILASIEENIRFLNSSRARKLFKKLVAEIEGVKSISNCDIFSPDITKLNVKSKSMSGFELSQLFYDQYNIEDERTNEKSTLLLCGLGVTSNMLKRLGRALNSIK